MHRKIDLHVHTTHSDGRSKPKAIIEKAIELSLTDLGIADHYGGLASYSIISTSHLEEYIAELTRLKELFQPKIRLWIGLEIAELDSLPFNLLNRLDFALIEDIEMDPRLGYFLSHIKPNLKVPVGIAHPQIIFLENTARILEKEGIFIELNTHYPDRYHSKWASLVWKKLVPTNIRISVASDAHDVKRVGSTMDAIDFIEKNNLRDKLLTLRQHAKP
ncbi:MAG: PHP domain-containing protein [Chloroflexi bacterium]|nr:PHP domain-containing protein [Chloroflexota bacterium]MBM3172371.1 PHP domain-containing protein [Chloroflexota bacterium]